MEKVKCFVFGMAVMLIIGLGVWLHWRIGNVERTTAQIVQFLNTPKQVQAAQPVQQTQPQK